MSLVMWFARWLVVLIRRQRSTDPLQDHAVKLALRALPDLSNFDFYLEGRRRRTRG